jgi:hypothetical protein
MAQTSGITTGGGYVEDDNFVPDPSDLIGQFNTSGTGAHQNLDAHTNAFAIDRQAVAEQVVRALDPKDFSVNSSAVILPDTDLTHEEAKAEILAKAEEIASTPLVLGEPGPAEAAAGETTDHEVNQDSMPVQGGVGTASPEQVGNVSTRNQATGAAATKADAKPADSASTAATPAATPASTTTATTPAV